MSGSTTDYIQYRLSKSQEALDDARMLATNQRWNACVNRLYYSCYYSVSALLLQNNFHAQTHSGVKALFNLHFIKPGKISIEHGKLYSDLMDWRQKGDYGDMFDFSKETVEPLLVPVANFIAEIKTLL